MRSLLRSVLVFPPKSPLGSIHIMGPRLSWGKSREHTGPRITSVAFFLKDDLGLGKQKLCYNDQIL